MRIRVDYHIILDMGGKIRDANYFTASHVHDFIHLVTVSSIFETQDSTVLVRKLMFPLDKALAKRQFLPINTWKSHQGNCNCLTVWYQPEKSSNIVTVSLLFSQVCF